MILSNEPGYYKKNKFGIRIENLIFAKSKGKKYGSVEEEALETFGAMKKAKAMEDELRNWLIATHGMNAWNDLLRIQAKIRKARAEEIKRKGKKGQKG